MSTAVATTKKALVPRWTKSQLELLKRTVAKGTTDDEFSLFIYTAKRTGLDPFIKQIYAIKRWDSATNGYIMGIQTGIDGYRLVAARTGELAGIDQPVFEPDAEEAWHPRMAIVTVYRFVNGERCAFVGEARWSEYAQKKKDEDGSWRYIGKWAQGEMPYNQLAKCAEAQAHRKAFPMDLSGIYTAEEMPVIEVEAVAETEGSGEAPAGPPPAANDLSVGVLTAYAPGDAKAKKAHRFTFKMDNGAELTLTAFERPASLKNEDPAKYVGNRVQFRYEEKPNKRGGTPYRNLTHFALEVLEPEHEPQEKNQAAPGSDPGSQTAPSGDLEEGTEPFYASLLRSASDVPMLTDLWNTISQEMAVKLPKDGQDRVKALFFSRKGALEKGQK